MKDEKEIVALSTKDLKELIEKAVKAAMLEVIVEFLPMGDSDTNEDKLYAQLSEAEFYSHSDLINIADELGINPNSAKGSISRLVEKRKIFRISRGKYFIPRKD